MTPLLGCPVCFEPLDRDERSYRCPTGHVFDVAREGYVNLLPAQQRHSKDPGYSKEMIAGRRDFFDAGHYEPLADGVAALLLRLLPDGSGPGGGTVILDAGCGEGYYLRRLRRMAGDRPLTLAGLDISKHGVRVAARRDPEGVYAVGGSYRMPVLPATVDVLLTHFSPVSADDFRRVVRPGGVVVVGGPNVDHLYEFKRLLYDRPEHFEPADPLTGVPGFEPIGREVIRYPLHLEGPGQVANLLLMTPYYWSVGDETRRRLAELDRLDVTVDVLMQAYRRVEPAGSGG